MLWWGLADRSKPCERGGRSTIISSLRVALLLLDFEPSQDICSCNRHLDFLPVPLARLMVKKTATRLQNTPIATDRVRSKVVPRASFYVKLGINAQSEALRTTHCLRCHRARLGEYEWYHS